MKFFPSLCADGLFASPRQPFERRIWNMPNYAILDDYDEQFASLGKLTFFWILLKIIF